MCHNIVDATAIRLCLFGTFISFMHVISEMPSSGFKLEAWSLCCVTPPIRLFFPTTAPLQKTRPLAVFACDSFLPLPEVERPSRSIIASWVTRSTTPPPLPVPSVFCFKSYHSAITTHQRQTCHYKLDHQPVLS